MNEHRSASPVISVPDVWNQKELMLGTDTDRKSIYIDPAWGKELLLVLVQQGGGNTSYDIPVFSVAGMTKLMSLEVFGVLNWPVGTIVLPASVQNVDMEDFTGITELDASALTECDSIFLYGWAFPLVFSLTTLRLPASLVTGVFAGQFPTTSPIANVIPQATLDAPYINLYSASLTETSVNAILLALLAGTTSGGMMDLSGGTSHAPTGAGITAKNTLVSTRGWSISTN